jgi:hypothetical protein
MNITNKQQNQIYQQLMNKKYNKYNKYACLTKCKIIGETYILYNNNYEFIVDFDIFKQFLKYGKPVQINHLFIFIYNFDLFKINFSYENKLIYKNKNMYDLRSENIEFDNNIDTVDNTTIYYDIIDDYGIIEYTNTENNKVRFCLDIDDLLYLFNFNTKIHQDEKNNSIYPFIKSHKSIIRLDDYIFNKIKPIKSDNIQFYFKNNDGYDLRCSNVSYRHTYHNTIVQTYPEATYIEGHYIGFGKHAFIMKNPMWKISDTEYIVLCDNNKTFYIDDKSLTIIKKYEKENNTKLTFHIGYNGYVVCNPNKKYIHQIIMDCYGNGKGTKKISVDHIDQNPENNCYSNLRIADRKTQEQNTKGIKPGTKRERKQNATSLPDGITQDMLPKYVVYYNRCYNKEKQLYREFFEINSHPKQNGKYISSSKSNKVSIFEKLEDIKQKLLSLDCDTYNTNYIIPDKYPKGVYIKEIRGSNHFVFDLRTEDLRYNLKMKIKQYVDETKEFERFREKIKTKYPTFEI